MSQLECCGNCVGSMLEESDVGNRKTTGSTPVS